MVPLVLTVAVNVSNLQIFYVEPRLLLPHIYLKDLVPFPMFSGSFSFYSTLPVWVKPLD